MAKRRLILGGRLLHFLLGSIVGFLSVVQFRGVLKTLKPVEIPEGYGVDMGVYTNLFVGLFGLVIIVYFVLSVQ